MREHSVSILKAFFVRHSSEHDTSYKDRKVNQNINQVQTESPDKMNMVPGLPFSWPVSTYSILPVEDSKGETNCFSCVTKQLCHKLI